MKGAVFQWEGHSLAWEMELVGFKVRLLMINHLLSGHFLPIQLQLPLGSLPDTHTIQHSEWAHCAVLSHKPMLPSWAGGTLLLSVWAGGDFGYFLALTDSHILSIPYPSACHVIQCQKIPKNIHLKGGEVYYVFRYQGKEKQGDLPHSSRALIKEKGNWCLCFFKDASPVT